MQLNDTLILRLNMDARVAGPFCYWVRVFYLAHTLMRVSVNKSMHVITYNTDSKGGGEATACTLTHKSSLYSPYQIFSPMSKVAKIIFQYGFLNSRKCVCRTHAQWHCYARSELLVAALQDLGHFCTDNSNIFKKNV